MEYTCTDLEPGDPNPEGVRIDRVRVIWQHDPDPDVSWMRPTIEEYMQDGVSEEEALKYAAQDRARSKAYEEGEWWFVGCYAQATVSYPIGDKSRRLENLQSGGLWGIESDADDQYQREIAQQEILDLRAHLEALGIGLAGWDEAVTAAGYSPSNVPDGEADGADVASESKGGGEIAG